MNAAAILLVIRHIVHIQSAKRKATCLLKADLDLATFSFLFLVPEFSLAAVLTSLLHAITLLIFKKDSRPIAVSNKNEHLLSYFNTPLPFFLINSSAMSKALCTTDIYHGEPNGNHIHDIFSFQLLFRSKNIATLKRVVARCQEKKGVLIDME
jgi:hypothetical protein